MAVSPQRILKPMGQNGLVFCSYGKIGYSEDWIRSAASGNDGTFITQEVVFRFFDADKVNDHKDGVRVRIDYAAYSLYEISPRESVVRNPETLRPPFAICGFANQQVRQQRHSA